MTAPELDVNPLTVALEEVYFDMLASFGEGRVVVDGDDVTVGFDEAKRDRLIRPAVGNYSGWELTDGGIAKLTELWGPDRWPPGKSGTFDCDDHGRYRKDPGDRYGCPACEPTLICR